MGTGVPREAILGENMAPLYEAIFRRRLRHQQVLQPRSGSHVAFCPSWALWSGAGSGVGTCAQGEGLCAPDAPSSQLRPARDQTTVSVVNPP